MKLEFQVLREEYVDDVIDCIYQCWKDNPWIKAFKTEKEAKQAFFDRINQPGVNQRSLVCIDRDTNKMVGCFLSQDIIQYLQNQQKWSFHKEFEVIEEFIQLSCQRIFEHCDPSLCIWGFWLSSTLPQSKLPYAFFTLNHRLNYFNGYNHLISFTNHPKMEKVYSLFNSQLLDAVELKDLKRAKFDKNITLYPQFGNFKMCKPEADKFLKQYQFKISPYKPKL